MASPQNVPARSRATQRRQHQQRAPVIKYKLPQTSPILVVDLEATCWDGVPPPAGEQQEIIEIGWALLDASGTSSSILKSGTILVRPAHSTVSKFCTELTTITQELLNDEGVTLKEAFDILENEVESKNHPWASYGDWDRNFVRKQCNIFGVQNPFSREHYNVKEACKSRYPKPRGGWGMKSSFEAILGRGIEGVHHRGGDDAYNIAYVP